MNWIEKLTNSNTVAGRHFDRLIYALILISMVLIAFETVPGAEAYKRFFAISELIIVAVFTIEYALRTIARGRHYVFSFFGFIDFVAILPFYLSFGIVDARTIRILRFLRLARVAKLHRYSRAWKRLVRAFREIKDELVVFCGMSAVLIYLSSVGIFLCERDAQPETFKSVMHSMWWAIATLSTVGYGDVYPITVAGKIFTSLILVIGLGFISVPSGLLASALSKSTDQSHKTTTDVKSNSD